jgi:hypothetical protein
MEKPRLTIELVPSTCFYSNVRTLLPKKVWDNLRVDKSLITEAQTNR